MRIDGGTISNASLELSNDFTTQAPTGAAGLTFVPPNDGVDPGDGGGADQIFESKKKPNNGGQSVSVTCREGTSPQATVDGQNGRIDCVPDDSPKPQPGRRPNPGTAPILD
jgi:hypothetical protein